MCEMYRKFLTSSSAQQYTGILLSNYRHKTLQL